MYQVVWAAATGTPPKAWDEYDPVTLLVLLRFRKEALEAHARLYEVDPRSDDEEWADREMAKLRRKRRRLMGGSEVSYGEPILTGDPVADEWERQIARGEMPDLDAPGRVTR